MPPALLFLLSIALAISGLLFPTLPPLPGTPSRFQASYTSPESSPEPHSRGPYMQHRFCIKAAPKCLTSICLVVLHARHCEYNKLITVPVFKKVIPQQGRRQTYIKKCLYFD
jgi:hypothetical protein